jgi:hypothetical protein
MDSLLLLSAEEMDYQKPPAATAADDEDDELQGDNFSMPDCIGEKYLFSLRQPQHIGDDGEESLGEDDVNSPSVPADYASPLHSSMSLFISELVGSHAEQQLVVQVDNAKPRDLPNPCNFQDNCSSTKKNVISRWESTPSKLAHTSHDPRRPRAMRPLPGGNQRDHSLKQIMKKTGDTPIMRPQRMDSNSSLIDAELSISDLGTAAQQMTGGSLHHSCRHDSMDLDALIAAAENDGGGGVYVQVPALLASETSLWSCASCQYHDSQHDE